MEGLAALTRLESLCLTDNRIASLGALALPHLAQLTALRSLYLQNLDRSAPNAVCRAPGYKAAVLAALPQLTNLDGERCGDNRREGRGSPGRGFGRPRVGVMHAGVSVSVTSTRGRLV